MSLRPGDAVEHFVIVSTLGVGGMGQVYLARDTRLQRSIALKIVRADLTAGDSGTDASNGAARLLREAQSVAALEHPNVVTIYEVGEIKGAGDEAGRPFIAMELVKGKSLRALIGDESVPMKERIRWLADAARALGAAHKASLVHRDIKPENVMLREDGVIKVLDFGLAKRATSAPASVSSPTEADVLRTLTGEGIAIGTPYYMAPEQMRREPLDGRADQFAWGVVAYELLSGVPAWGSDVTPLELVAKLLSEDPTPLEEVRPDVPRHVAAAVKRAMSKRKGARFETMGDLLAALEDESGVLAETVALPAAPAPEPARKETPSLETATRSGGPAARAGLWLGLGAASILLAAGGFFARSAWRGAATQAPAPGASGASAAPPECTKATECVKKLGGAPAVCNPHGRCALVESDQCKAHYEPSDLARDDTMWIGGMFPIGTKGEMAGRVDANAVELARRDFAEAMGNYRAPPGAPAARPLATVVCDSEPSGREPARHLVEDVGVPVVIDGQRSAATIDLARSTYLPAGVLTLATEAISPLLTSVQQGQPRLVFRTTYDNTDVAKGIAALAEKIEADLRARHALGTDGELRVALLRGKGAAASAFAEALFGALVFNGKSALDNGKAYMERSYESDQELDRAAHDVALFEPQVVIVSSSGSIFSKIEASWPRRVSARPMYLTPTAHAEQVFAFAGSSAERRRRVLGFTLASTSMTNARLVVHYNETFAEKVTRTLSPNSTYDAFYVAAYAALASKLARPTGLELSRMIAQTLPPGRPVDVGPTGIFGAFSTLARGERIDLNGSAGSLDFDLATGNAPGDFAIVCADVGAAGVADSNVESGMTYGARSGNLDGEARCP